MSSSGVMAAGGEYRDQSQTQHEAAAVGYPLIETAVAGVGGSTPSVIADLGAASGNNSLRPLKLALDALASDRVLVVHTDLPDNDFRTLFGVVDHDSRSYLVGRDEVFPVVAGRSFYRRVLPRASLAFGWSASSLHWLSAAPRPIPDHFFVHLSSDTDVQRDYRQRSREDWVRFLDHRAVELQPGAGLVIVDVLRGADGLMGSEALFDRLAAALTAQRDAGVITGAEYAQLGYPTWFRSRADLADPFQPTFTATDGSVLELAEVRESTLADPFAALLEQGRRAEYAQEQTGFLRAFLEPSFTAQLSAERDAGSRAAAVDAIFGATERAIAADPDAVSPAYRLCAVRIAKQP